MSIGKLVLVTGPSGVGKQTLIRHALATFSDCELTTSATTRTPRPGEEDGKDYHFLSQEQFRKQIEARDFAEYAQYAGNYYGTLRSSIDQPIAQGKNVLLELEVQGARQLMAKYPNAISIFILPPEPMIETLRRRLLERATETPERMERRLTIARSEIEEASRFKHRVINADLAKAKSDFAILLAEEFGLSTV